ncbi:MAG: PilT/PilU family type 4a pilus ATPase [Myxococcales bacterium]|nr:MAG: PilT/PilU family type 4a pilus ATPase [Myxococcales bacterium]
MPRRESHECDKLPGHRVQHRPAGPRARAARPFSDRRGIGRVSWAAVNGQSSLYSSEAYLHQLLAKAVAAKASDVHIKVGQPPGARVRGEMVYFRLDRINPADTEACARLIIRDPTVAASLDQLQEYDTSYAVPKLGRFRVNIYRQRGTLAMVLRSIPQNIPTFEDLGCPPACRFLAERERGLVLVVGAAGNGKSSTLASMIGHINRTQATHIVTVEDPIEFLHADERSSISQREVGLDTHSFAGALRAALRQDPDVILVGEIRDEETMEIALKAAETGHLVLSTLHTPDVARTVNRILSLAPDRGQADMRDRIADALQGVVAQRLLPRKDGQGLALVAEVLVVTGTARETIKNPQGGTPPLKEVMEKGQSPYGMQTFEMHSKVLVQQGIIERDVARTAAAF